MLKAYSSLESSNGDTGSQAEGPQDIIDDENVFVAESSERKGKDESDNDRNGSIETLRKKAARSFSRLTVNELELQQSKPVSDAPEQDSYNDST